MNENLKLWQSRESWKFPQQNLTEASQKLSAVQKLRFFSAAVPDLKTHVWLNHVLDCILPKRILINNTSFDSRKFCGHALLCSWSYTFWIYNMWTDSDSSKSDFQHCFSLPLTFYKFSGAIKKLQPLLQVWDLLHSQCDIWFVPSRINHFIFSPSHLSSSGGKGGAGSWEACLTI